MPSKQPYSGWPKTVIDWDKGTITIKARHLTPRREYIRRYTAAFVFIGYCFGMVIGNIIYNFVPSDGPWSLIVLASIFILPVLWFKLTAGLFKTTTTVQFTSDKIRFNQSVPFVWVEFDRKARHSFCEGEHPQTIIDQAMGGIGYWARVSTFSHVCMGSRIIYLNHMFVIYKVAEVYGYDDIQRFLQRLTAVDFYMPEFLKQHGGEGGDYIL